MMKGTRTARGVCGKDGEHGGAVGVLVGGVVPVVAGVAILVDKVPLAHHVELAQC